MVAVHLGVRVVFLAAVGVQPPSFSVVPRQGHSLVQVV